MVPEEHHGVIRRILGLAEAQEVRKRLRSAGAGDLCVIYLSHAVLVIDKALRTIGVNLLILPVARAAGLEDHLPEDTPASVEGNLLTGTATDTYITAESGYAYYVLDKPEGKEVGMYKAKLTDGQFLNNANRAYLALDLGNLGIFDDEVDTEEEGGQLSNGLRFHFGGTTAIDNVEFTNDNFENVIYDLQGRRVEKPTKPGIYIVNGQKVMVR